MHFEREKTPPLLTLVENYWSKQGDAHGNRHGRADGRRDGCGAQPASADEELQVTCSFWLGKQVDDGFALPDL